MYYNLPFRFGDYSVRVTFREVDGKEYRFRFIYALSFFEALIWAAVCGEHDQGCDELYQIAKRLEYFFVSDSSLSPLLTYVVPFASFVLRKIKEDPCADSLTKNYFAVNSVTTIVDKDFSESKEFLLR